MFFTGGKFGARDAEMMGFVNRVYADDALDEAALAMARTIAGNAPMTVGSVKFIVGEALRPDPDETACDASVRACFASEDYVEGRRAFMEKRRPVFQGR